MLKDVNYGAERFSVLTLLKKWQFGVSLDYLRCCEVCAVGPGGRYGGECGIGLISVYQMYTALIAYTIHRK